MVRASRGEGGEEMEDGAGEGEGEALSYSSMFWTCNVLVS